MICVTTLKAELNLLGGGSYFVLEDGNDAARLATAIASCAGASAPPTLAPTTVTTLRTTVAATEDPNELIGSGDQDPTDGDNGDANGGDVGYEGEEGECKDLCRPSSGADYCGAISWDNVISCATLKPCTVRVFRQKFPLEDAIGSHACSLQVRFKRTCV
jgi:hypothetical protein